MPGPPEIVCDIAYPRPERVYPHAVLVQLQDHPVAQRWPPYLDPIYKNARGVWDPDRWHHDRKRGDTPVSLDERERPGFPGGGQFDQLPVKRAREKDLERVSGQQEDDSIVLSPQRRSFLTGCQSAKDDLVLKPEQPGGGRRVGSGRILARETAGPEEFPLNKPPRNRNDRELGRDPWDRDGRAGEREARPGEYGGVNKFAFRRDLDEDRRLDDRRSYYQHDERASGRGAGDRRMIGGGGGGLANRGRMGDGGSLGNGGGGMKRFRQESEPEWMSESVSMSDMIELRGFDEPKSLQPGMSLEELEQRQQPQPEAAQRQQAKPDQQHQPAGRSSAKPDAVPVTAASTGTILTDFLKSGRAATPVGAAGGSGEVHQVQQPQVLPPGILEAIMGSGRGGGMAAGQADTGGFNFDSIMTEAVNLNNLFGTVAGSGAEGDSGSYGGAAAAGGGAKTGPPTKAVQQLQTAQQFYQEPQPQQQSRFSQFFNKAAPEAETALHQQPQPQHNSRRSSIQDELLGSNILREINGEATIRIPSPEEEAVVGGGSSKYFTPISPAAKTSGPSQGGTNLLEMLHKSSHQQQQEEGVVRQLEDGIKRSLGLGEADGGGQQQLLAGGHHHHQLYQHGPPGLQHIGGGGGAHFQLPGGLLGFPPPHHLQQQLLQQQQQGGAANRPQQRAQQQSQDSDMSAFKKLVAQVKGSGPPSTAPPPDLAGGSLLGLLRHGGGGGGSVRLYTEQDLLEGRVKGQHPPPPQQRARFSHPAIPAPLVRFLDQYPWNPEVLKRSEAEHLILGLNSGSFSLENIVQQLSNPALQVRQRELILTVLKLKTSGLPPPTSGPAAAPPFMMNGIPPLGSALLPPRTSPLPGQQYAAHHHASAAAATHHGGRGVSPLMGGVYQPGATNHLAVSPVPPSQRIPSPQEMTVLTQQIMQQALIKRKLEEQKENYRRRQGEVRQDKEDKENIRGVKYAESNTISSSSGPGPSAAGVLAGSPLAFTPTSVMRKNAAERKDSDPRLGVPELKISSNQDRGGAFGGSGRGERQAPPSPGRPITKGKTDRPDRLDLSGQQQQPGGGGSPSHGGPGPGLLGPAPPHGPPFNPLLFLQNAHMHNTAAGLNSEPGRGHQGHPSADPRLMMGNSSGGGGNNQLPAVFLAAAAAAGVGSSGGMTVGNNNNKSSRMSAAFSAAAATPSPRSNQGVAGSSGGDTPLARFFSPDVLAAAQGGACPPMPPLPIRQALTLEEIERQAAAAAVRI